VAAHLATLASAFASSPVLLAIVPVALASHQPQKLLVGNPVGGGLVGQAARIAIVAALPGLGQTHHLGSPNVGQGVDIAQQDPNWSARRGAHLRDHPGRHRALGVLQDDGSPSFSAAYSASSSRSSSYLGKKRNTIAAPTSTAMIPAA
jgi:hypothetical protein